VTLHRHFEKGEAESRKLRYVTDSALGLARSPYLSLRQADDTDAACVAFIEVDDEDESG
jgi:hypothetical protein